MVQALFTDGDSIFQDDNAPIHTAHVDKNWYDEYERELEHIEWPPQSADFNIIEHLWCILERQVGNSYTPSSCLKELDQVLMEESLKVSLDEVKKLHESIIRRIEAAQKAGGGPTPY